MKLIFEEIKAIRGRRMVEKINPVEKETKTMETGLTPASSGFSNEANGALGEILAKPG